MTDQVTITLSTDLSERVRQLAKQRDQDIIAIVEAILSENLPDNVASQDWIDLSEPDEAAEREMKAYIELHPMLREKYFGKHVAIHNGQLIDYDTDHSALYERINARYPDEFVWMSEVKEEPIQTFFFRSPRFEQE
ncbi:MAG: DUF5678 domain-containing protein [Caldilineaceae bacterium]